VCAAARAPSNEAPRHWSIGQLARRFRLARSTLLYYDRLGLLRPVGRTRARYRVYDQAAEARLAAICRYRALGLSLQAIRGVLESRDEPARLLADRFAALDGEIARCREQQRVIAEILRAGARGNGAPARLDKARWVAILRATGLDDEAMHRWHAEFERAAPEAHQEFLETLHLSPAEVARIRRAARGRA
jgi:DNA-binding transcriptional MerR regulator